MTQESQIGARLEGHQGRWLLLGGTAGPGVGVLLHKLRFKKHKLNDMKLYLLIELYRLIDDSVNGFTWWLLLWSVEKELCQEPNCVVLKDKLSTVNKLAAHLCMFPRQTLFHLSLLYMSYEVLAHQSHEEALYIVYNPLLF